MVDITSLNAIPESSEWSETILQLENGWRPTGGPINLTADEGLLNAPLQDLANRTVWLRDRVEDLSLRAGNVVTVGATGDFTTLNDALEELSSRRPGYIRGGFQTEVRLLAGYVMQEQVIVNGVNLGWITITSESPEVFIDRAYLTSEPASGLFPAFAAFNGGTLPIIATLFTMMLTGTATGRTGIALISNASAVVLPGCGVRNAGANGAFMNSCSSLNGNGAIFTGAGLNGIAIAGGSVAAMASADLSGAAASGALVQNGGSLQVENGNLSGCVTAGITAQRGSNVNANGANCRRGGSDSATDIVATGGSIINAGATTGGTSITPNTVTVNGVIFK
jgi:hypothetical protein